VVLERGKLVEEGTHNKLFKKEGKYYKMWQQQFPMMMKNLTVSAGAVSI
jgi:ABC-type transport system involved in cytochrome bd biosynthesis fused ATPase/permease subunit